MADPQAPPARRPVGGIAAGVVAALVALFAIDRWANPPEKALEGEVPFRHGGPTPTAAPRATKPETSELPTTPGRATHMPGVVRRPGEGDISFAVPAPRLPGALAAAPAKAPAGPPVAEDVRRAVEEAFARLESEKEWGGGGSAAGDPAPPAESDPTGRAAFLRIMGAGNGGRLSANWEAGAGLLTACRRAGLQGECRRASGVCLKSAQCGSWLATHLGIL
ncbi:MAG: hypothetical protein HY553_04115 [Elusimicrobia bacterium]|nr:hypothetical protein [Elusimicrobiota bacterium]